MNNKDLSNLCIKTRGVFALLDDYGILQKKDFSIYVNNKRQRVMFCLALPHDEAKAQGGCACGLAFDRAKLSDAKATGLAYAMPFAANLLARYFANLCATIAEYDQGVYAGRTNPKSLDTLSSTRDFAYMLNKYEELAGKLPTLQKLLDQDSHNLVQHNANSQTALKMFQQMRDERYITTYTYQQLANKGLFYCDYISLLLPLMIPQKSFNMNTALQGIMHFHYRQLNIPVDAGGFAKIKYHI